MVRMTVDLGSEVATRSQPHTILLVQCHDLARHISDLGTSSTIIVLPRIHHDVGRVPRRRDHNPVCNYSYGESFRLS